MNYPLSRLLIDPHAADREAFRVYGNGSLTFVTGGVNGKTAEETAVRNLADISEHVPGTLILEKLDHGLPILATAEAGLVRPVPPREERGRIMEGQD